MSTISGGGQHRPEVPYQVPPSSSIQKSTKTNINELVKDINELHQNIKKDFKVSALALARLKHARSLIQDLKSQLENLEWDTARIWNSEEFKKSVLRIGHLKNMLQVGVLNENVGTQKEEKEKALKALQTVEVEIAQRENAPGEMNSSQKSALTKLHKAKELLINDLDYISAFENQSKNVEKSISVLEAYETNVDAGVKSQQTAVNYMIASLTDPYYSIKEGFELATHGHIFTGQEDKVTMGVNFGPANRSEETFIMQQVITTLINDISSGRTPPRVHFEKFTDPITKQEDIHVILTGKEKGVETSYSLAKLLQKVDFSHIMLTDSFLKKYEKLATSDKKDKKGFIMRPPCFLRSLNTESPPSVRAASPQPPSAQRAESTQPSSAQRAESTQPPSAQRTESTQPPPSVRAESTQPPPSVRAESTQPPSSVIGLPPSSVIALKEILDLHSELKDLSLAEALAINLYSGFNYKAINEFLRGHVTKAIDRVKSNLTSIEGSEEEFINRAIGELLLHTATIISGLSKLPDYQPPIIDGKTPQYLWRGEIPTQGEPDIRRKAIEEGGMTTFEMSLMSTSAGKPTPAFFASAEAIAILENVKGKDIHLLSNMPQENEVLFMPCQIQWLASKKISSPYNDIIDVFIGRPVPHSPIEEPVKPAPILSEKEAAETFEHFRANLPDMP